MNSIFSRHDVRDINIMAWLIGFLDIQTSTMYICWCFLDVSKSPLRIVRQKSYLQNCTFNPKALDPCNKFILIYTTVSNMAHYYMASYTHVCSCMGVHRWTDSCAMTGYLSSLRQDGNIHVHVSCILGIIPTASHKKKVFFFNMIKIFIDQANVLSR